PGSLRSWPHAVASMLSNKMKDIISRRCILGILGLMSLMLTACGGASATQTPSTTDTPFPTFRFVAPTEAPSVVTVGAATATAGVSAALDPDQVEAGKGRYVALQCGTCHGDDAKGTDKGPALVGTKLNQGEFVNMLRSGGKLGNDHLYST